MTKKFLRIGTVMFSALFAWTALSLFASANIFSARAQEKKLISDITAYDSKDKNERLLTLTRAHIERNMQDNIEIERIKELKDFADTTYTLFELAPTGYIIYHSESGQFIEYTSISSSPYLGFEGELYYGGMMQYYYRNGDELSHTLKEDTSIPLAEAGHYADACRQMNLSLKEDTEFENLSYIGGESTVVPSRRIFSEKTAMKAAYPNTPRISMEYFFLNLRTEYQIGYRDGEACGYIASNMIVGYNYFAYDYGLVPDYTYVNEYNFSMRGPKLTDYILTVAGKDPNKPPFSGTAANDAYGYMKDYLKTVSPFLTWQVSWSLFNINAQGSIEQGHPVGLYGNFIDPRDEVSKTNHAVVGYGYENGHFVVHFGWDSRTRVITAGGLIGTTFCMKIKN